MYNLTHVTKLYESIPQAQIASALDTFSKASAQIEVTSKAIAEVTSRAQANHEAVVSQIKAISASIPRNQIESAHRQLLQTYKLEDEVLQAIHSSLAQASSSLLNALKPQREMAAKEAWRRKLMFKARPRPYNY